MKIEGFDNVDFNNPQAVRNLVVQKELEIQELRTIVRSAHKKAADLQSDLVDVKHKNEFLWGCMDAIVQAGCLEKAMYNGALVTSWLDKGIPSALKIAPRQK